MPVQQQNSRRNRDEGVGREAKPPVTMGRTLSSRRARNEEVNLDRIESNLDAMFVTGGVLFGPALAIH